MKRSESTQIRGEYVFRSEGITLTLMQNGIYAFSAKREMPDKMHVHAAYELFYVRSGVLHFHTDRGMTEVTADKILLVAPNTPHYADVADAPDHAVLKFDAATEKGGYAFPILDFKEYTVLSGSNEAKALATMAFDAITKKHGTVAGSLLFSLLLWLSAEEASDTLADNTAQRLYHMEEFLHYYSEDICNLRRLAEELHLSERHLSRVIKRECGATFRQRLRMTRIEAARRLLADGHPVSEVAAAVGYSSLSAFYTAYKRHCGVAPGKERKKEKKNIR